MDAAGAAAGLDENQFVEPLNFVADAELRVEVDQIGAAAEQHMLTVIYYFTSAGMFIGGSASAHVRPALEQGDVEIRTRERTTGGQSRQAAANDRYSILLSFRRHAMRSRNPRESTFSFSQKLRWIRSVRTS